MKFEKTNHLMAGKAGVGILLVIVLAALSGYLVIGRPDLAKKYLPGLLAKPTPEATPVATPTPEATPVAEATPAPEAPLDFAEVAATRTLWPKQVALVQQTSFPLIYNGKVVGQAPAPVGTLLQVVQVLPDPTNPRVEVLFQNNREIVSASVIDLLQRAEALKKAAPAKPVSSSPVSSPASIRATPVPPPPMMHGVKFSDRVTVEVVRQKTVRAVDTYDDKQDDIRMKVKLTNSDPSKAFDKNRGTIYILAEDLENPTKTKVLGIESFDFSLPALGNFEKITSQVTSGRYDQERNSSRSGFRYGGWYLRIVDGDGGVVVEKATTPSILKRAESIIKTKVGGEFSRKP
ncbi:MAG: hypothetical protein WCQ16_03810 [Verrucomicrobiae bacterium]